MTVYSVYCSYIFGQHLDDREDVQEFILGDEQDFFEISHHKQRAFCRTIEEESSLAHPEGGVEKTIITKISQMVFGRRFRVSDDDFSSFLAKILSKIMVFVRNSIFLRFNF